MPAPESRSSEIARLLVEARSAFDANRLTTPAEHSAYSRYQRILELDPGNTQAMQGIQAITEQYLSWALNHAAQDNYKRARQYVHRAVSIDPDNPNIQAVLSRILEKEKAVVTTVRINPVALSRRRVSDKVLQHITRQIKPNETFVTIRAPDDASGRWLYQALNNRVEFRIEAKFEQSTEPSVSLSR